MSDHVEPCGLANRIAETREATRRLWGEAEVKRLLADVDVEVRAAFAPQAKLDKWVPERLFVAWMNAVWEGPCGRKSEPFARWVDEVTDCGFGRATKLLLSLASPWIILRRAQSLWRNEHSHGELVVARLDSYSVRATLRNHPFVDTDVSRAAISEAIRHILILSRASTASETHELVGDALHIMLTWS